MMILLFFLSFDLEVRGNAATKGAMGVEL